MFDNLSLSSVKIHAFLAKTRAVSIIRGFSLSVSHTGFFSRCFGVCERNVSARFSLRNIQIPQSSSDIFSFIMSAKRSILYSCERERVISSIRP